MRPQSDFPIKKECSIHALNVAALNVAVAFIHTNTHTSNKCLVGNFHANITGVSYFLEMCHFWYRLMNLLLFMPFKRDACDLRHTVKIILPHDIQSMGQYLSISNNRIFDWSISFLMHICYGHRTGHKMW